MYKLNLFFKCCMLFNFFLKKMMGGRHVGMWRSYGGGVSSFIIKLTLEIEGKIKVSWEYLKDFVFVWMQGANNLGGLVLFQMHSQWLMLCISCWFGDKLAKCITMWIFNILYFPQNVFISLFYFSFKLF